MMDSPGHRGSVQFNAISSSKTKRLRNGTVLRQPRIKAKPLHQPQTRRMIMAMYDDAGQRHHSASRARLANENRTADMKKPTAPEKKPDGGAAMGGEGGGDLSHMAIHEVVKAHGPAHKVEIEHNHEAGSHKKTSHHGKGHTHTSEHGSVSEAHHAGMEAAGESPANADDETPDQANGEGEDNMAAMSSGGGGVAGLSD
jgi:hypothetical protein